jgi:predicted SAM-dependent methyltransferase
MKLHIGGEEVKAGWRILNAKRNLGVDYIGDISDLSQFESDSIDEIYASHVLEHVSQVKALPTLKGLHRILKTSGRVYISVPDLDVLSHAIINPELSPQIKFQVMRMMFGGQMDDLDYHYFGWNQLFLSCFLSQAGFKKIESFVF